MSYSVQRETADEWVDCRYELPLRLAPKHVAALDKICVRGAWPHPNTLIRYLILEAMKTMNPSRTNKPKTPTKKPAAKAPKRAAKSTSKPRKAAGKRAARE